MPDPTPATTPLTAEAVAGLITAALKPVTEAMTAMQANQKVIADTMAADAAAKTKVEADAAKAAAAATPTPTPATATLAPLTAEAVSKLLNDTLATRDQQAQSTAARNAFLAEKMKDVPAAYRGALGNDPAKWTAEEQKIRETLKADLSAMGAKVPDISGGNATGSSGNAAPAQRAPNSLTGALTKGQAAFAETIVLPK
jgi:hypothetical protein